MKLNLALVSLMAATIVFLGCGSGDKAPTADEQAKFAAKVDQWTFSRDELQNLIDRLPDSDKLRYDTPGGRAELADKVIEEELYYREALKLGMQNDEEVKQAVEQFTRAKIVQSYYKKEIEPLAHPTEEEMKEFYEDNPERFSRQPIVRAQHIFSTSKEKLEELKERFEAGEKFTTLAQKYSEDEKTKADGGDLGYFNPGGYIRGIGYSDEISDACFSLPVGVVSDPIKWRKGWSIVVVNEIRPAEVRPFDEVSSEIVQYFVVKRLDRVKEVAFQEIRKNYKVQNLMADELKLTTRTAEELWNLAQNSSDSYQRLRNYEEIVERFPKSEHAAKAMFMVGFVNAEELKDYVAADRAFTRVLNEYPDSEVAESAKYMLETMNTPAPKFQDPGESDDSDESSDE